MEQVKILIVDDEVLIAEDLKDMLNTLGISNTEMAHDKEEAIQLVNSYKPDIVLLDIRMENETDGIDIAEHISKNAPRPFIYITAHSDVEMIRKIVKTKPAAYITKPVKKSDLFAAVSLASEQLQPASPKVFRIKDGYTNVNIAMDSILYIESDGNYVNIFCEDKKYVSRQSLDSVIADLDATCFFRIQRSYVINTAKTKRYSKKEVEIGNITLPVSRNLGEDFERFMQKRG